MFTSAYFLIAALAILSPVALSFTRDGPLDRKSLATTVGAGALVALLPLVGLGDAKTLWSLFLAQTLLGAAFVSVSRMRQRKSAFLHAVMSTFSNGSWYIVTAVLAGAYLAAEHSLGGFALTVAFAGFLVASVAGFLAGRLTGVQWMLWFERRYGITVDSVDSLGLRRLDRATVPALVTAVAACFGAYWLFALAPMGDVCVVLVLGFTQASIYALNTRLSNRNHPGWPTITGIVGGVVFVIHYAYLLGYTKAGGVMPPVLFVPYIVATVAGSNLGALVSMFYERVLGLDTSAPAKDKKEYEHVRWHRYVLYVTGGVCGAYILASTPILAFFGIVPHAIALPFSFHLGVGLERPLALIAITGVYVVNSTVQTLLSRAGNRNNVSFHTGMAIVGGGINFLTSTFVILNARFLDLIPVVAFSSTLGQFWGQQVSIRVERALGAVMDIPK